MRDPRSKRLRPTALTAALAATLAPAGAAAQETTAAAGDGVVVTASRAGLTPREIGSAVTVVDQETLQRQQIRRVAEILQDVPGVRVTQTRPGAFTQVSVRGSDGDQVLVLLDGIRLADPSSTSTQFVFDHLTSLDIERIEVLRGNQSSLYGSDAIGGVINIITRRPTQDGFLFNGEAEIGSYLAADGGGSLFWRNDRVDLRFTVFGNSADGPSIADPATATMPVAEDDDYAAGGISGRFGFQILDNLVFDATGFYSISTLDYDSTPEDSFDQVDKDEFALGGRLVWDLFDNRLSNEFSASIYDAERTFDTGFSRPEGDLYDGTLTRFGYTGTFAPIDWATLVVGASYLDESTTQITDFSGNFDASIDTTSIFGELAVEPLAGLTVTGAARLDDNSRFGTFDTYRATVAYFADVAPGLSVKPRASVGTGAKAPGLYQLFDPQFGNADLEVEESTGWDVGFDVFWDRADLAAEFTYFHNDVTNEIDFDFAQGGYIQRGETEAEGIEVGLAARPTNWLILSQSYTWLLSQDSETGSWLGRPRHAGTTSVTALPTDRWEITARARFATENAASFGGTSDEYIVFDALVSYQATENVQIYGRVENLFDTDYQEQFGRQTNGISVFGGLRVSLGWQ